MQKGVPEVSPTPSAELAGQRILDRISDWNFPRVGGADQVSHVAELQDEWKNLICPIPFPL